MAKYHYFEKNERREKRVNVYFNEGEYAYLKSFVDTLEDRTLSEYIRQAVLTRVMNERERQKAEKE